MKGKINKPKVVLVGKNDNVVGYIEKFAAHKNPVPLHRAISVVIFSPDRKSMLLQKKLYRFIYKAEMDETWGEHELDVVFEGLYDGIVSPNPDEATDFKWMS